MPLSTSDWNWYSTTTEDLATEFPNTSIHPADFMGWAQDSFEIAVNYVYPDFTTGQVPLTTYDNTAIPILESHMMLAGARLANLIETIFETNTMFLQ